MREATPWAASFAVRVNPIRVADCNGPNSLETNPPHFLPKFLMFDSPQPSIHQKAYAMYNNVSLSSTKAEPATGSRNIYGFIVENLNDVPVYLHIYDAATADVTVGTTTPTWSIPVPANGYADRLSPMPLRRLGTGFVVAITTSKTGGAGTPDIACLTEINYK